MVLLQRSERLDPKSSLAWLHSGRCVVWHAALRLLYLGQGTYFFVLVHGKMIDTDETWNSAELFPGFYSNMRQWKGWGPWSWGMHTHQHKMSFPVALGFLLWKVGDFSAFFFNFVAFHEHYTWPGHFCLRSTCETSLGYPNLFQKPGFSIHHPFLETFYRNVLNIMTVLTSINTGQYFLSWSKLLLFHFPGSKLQRAIGMRTDVFITHQK